MSKTEHTPGTSAMTYSFGTFEVKIDASGNIHQPDELVDHMLTTATAALAAESILQGISKTPEYGGTRQTCRSSVEFGEIKLTAEITVDLKRSISNRKLNTIMFTVVIPRIWESAGLFLGENQVQTTPPEPLAPRHHLKALSGVDDTLGLRQHDGYQPTNMNENREFAAAINQ